MKWIPAWTGAAQGPYPIGSPAAQPDLSDAFPSAERGAADQTLRLIIKPDIWGKAIRLRFSNAFGLKPVTFDGAFVGLHWSSGAIVPSTNQPVTFTNSPDVTIAPGACIWSDPVTLNFVGNNDIKMLMGRNLAVSFHVVGESGPMTWHAKAMSTSYLTPPGSGSQGHTEGEAEFKFSTTSWYFLNAVEMLASDTTQTVVVFGDSISDGTFTTLNGDDRWSDVLSRRLHTRYGDTVSVVNAGIGGNRVVGPRQYSAEHAVDGGPSAQDRLERDVLSLSNVSTFIWLQGINDFCDDANASVQDVVTAMRETVSRIRKKFPHSRIVGATLTSALGSTIEGYGSINQDKKRLELNNIIRNGCVFDAYIDFDAATSNCVTGQLKREYQRDSTTGGPSDGLHPNRVGHLAMGATISVDSVIRTEQAWID